MKGYAEIRPYLTRTQPPSGGASWWVGKDRAAFKEAQQQQMARWIAENKPVLLIDGDAMAERKRDKRIVFGEEEA